MVFGQTMATNVSRNYVHWIERLSEKHDCGRCRCPCLCNLGQCCRRCRNHMDVQSDRRQHFIRLGSCRICANPSGLDYLSAGLRGGFLLAVSQVGVALTLVLGASGGTPKESCCHRDFSLCSRLRKNLRFARNMKKMLSFCVSSITKVRPHETQRFYFRIGSYLSRCCIWPDWQKRGRNTIAK